MRRIGLLFTLMAFVAASTASAQGATVMAAVSYPDLPARSRTVVLEIVLEDVTTPDRPSVVASARIPRPETSPMMVSLNYDTAAITPANRYAVRARVVDAGVTLFSSRASVRVLTGGHGSFANVSLITAGAEPAPAEPTPAAAAVARTPAQAPAATRAPAAPPAPRVTAPRGTLSAVLSGPKVTLARAAAPAPPKAPSAPKTASATSAATKSAPPKPQPAPKTTPTTSAPPKSAVTPPVKPAAEPPKAAPAPIRPTPTTSSSSVVTPKPVAPPAPTVTLPESSPPVATPPVKPAAEPPKAAPPVAPVVPAGRPAEPIVDLPATFTGEMPCADCVAIHYELTLAADSSYSLKKTFQGGRDRVQMEAGSWDYSSDRIVLVLKSSHDAWSWFAVRPEGVLRAVDSRGESIGRRAPADLVRSNAVASTVAKTSGAGLAAPVTISLSEALWTLTELENKPVRPATDKQRAIVMGFDSRARVFSGASGCNVLEGAFSATWRALTLTPTAPLRVCRIDQSTERALSRTIKATRTYRITGTTMDWFDEKGVRIARFEGQRRD